MKEEASPRGRTPAIPPRPDHEQEPVPTPPPADQPATKRRHPWRWVLAWTIAVLAVAGLTVPAVIATESAARVADPGVERYAPTQPGSTSVFTTRTNGKDTGLEYEQVAGRAQVVSLTPNTVAIADHFDDFVGSGSPLDVRTYEALDGDRLLSFGSRSGTNEFQQSTPPEVLLQPPLSKGASWTWHGKRQGRTGRTVTTIEEVADRTVLGRGFDDCLRIRVTSHEADANNVASTDVTESWTCPDAGLVQTVEDFTQGTTTIHYEANIVAVHRPGLNLRGPGAPPVPATGGEAHLGQTDGIDAGKTWFVPGAKLSTSHLAWSISRTLDALYQPIANGNDVITAEDDGTIAEIDVRTGQVVWQVGLTGPIVASPTAAGGLLLVGDSSKTLWALDPATGRTVWAIRLPDVVAATPAVLDGIAVVATDDRAVRGIELSTGRQVWSGSTSALVVSPPVVAGDLVVVGDQDGNLRALRPRDGSTAWSSSSFPLLTSGTSLLGGLSAGGGLVLAATDGAAVFAFDASNGRLEWRSLAPGTIDRPVAIAGDRVVVAADNSVVALDLRTGARVWRRDTDTSFAPPIVLGDTAAVLQTNNLLLTFALADGTESKMRIGAPSRQTDQDTQLPMTWAAGSLIVPTHNVGPWPFSIYQAFPAPVGSAAAQPARGVRLAGDFYGPGGPPSGPSSLGEGRMLEAPMAVFSENSASGKIVESHPGGPDTSPTRVLFHTTSIPGYAVAAGDRVITQVGSEMLGVPLRGGKPWVAQGGRIAVAPAVVPAAAGHPPVAVIADVQEGLTGVDASTGAHLWGPIAKPAAGGFGSPIVLPDGTVAWGGGGVTVLDPASGRILRQNTKVSPVTTLATDAGGLYAVAFAGSDFALARFDATTLQPVWANKFSPATIGGALPIGPGAGDGIVAAVDSKAALHAFDGATGKELWSLQLRMIPNSAPVVWQGRVYVEEPGFGEDIDQHEHRITVLDAHTGAFEASWAIPGANYSLGAFSQSRDRVLVSLPTGVGAIAPEQR